MRIRVVLALAVLSALGLELHAASPSLLVSAIEKMVQEESEWAYTQVIRRGDKPDAETVARFDPTRPRDAQWELVKLRGKTPTQAEAERWCRRRNQEITKSDGQVAAELLDLENAKVSEESAEDIRFEVPLKPNALKRLPSENFVVFVDVDRSEQAITRLSFALRQAVRLIGGVAQIESAEGEVRFAPAPDGETMRPVYATASGRGQALFKKMNRSAEVFYVDQRRVKS
jgi:hypothetical protein